jgi:hypothetical protein
MNRTVIYCMTSEQSDAWEGSSMEHARVTEQIVEDIQVSLDDPQVGSVRVVVDTGEVAFQAWRE